MKHTPAPWSHENIKKIFTRGPDVHSDLSNVDADSRLAAAAPEMFEMLLRCAGQFETQGKAGWVESIDAVLRKAKGES